MSVEFLPICCRKCRHLITSPPDGCQEHSCAKHSFRPFRTGICKLYEPVLKVSSNGSRQLFIFEVKI